ncbi:hypothetical protein V1506DRAFT_34540 [Lipomyces tetrasporus]
MIVSLSAMIGCALMFFSLRTFRLSWLVKSSGGYLQMFAVAYAPGSLSNRSPAVPYRLCQYVLGAWPFCRCRLLPATQPRGGIPQDFICRTVGVASTHLDWWSVRQSGREGAQKTLLRLTSPSDPTFNPDETIAKIEHTNELEKAMSAATTYWDCFSGLICAERKSSAVSGSSRPFVQ